MPFFYHNKNLLAKDTYNLQDIFGDLQIDTIKEKVHNQTKALFIFENYHIVCFDKYQIPNNLYNDSYLLKQLLSCDFLIPHCDFLLDILLQNVQWLLFGHTHYITYLKIVIIENSQQVFFQYINPCTTCHHYLPTFMPFKPYWQIFDYLVQIPYQPFKNHCIIFYAKWCIVTTGILQK